MVVAVVVVVVVVGRGREGAREGGSIKSSHSARNP